RGGLGGRGGGGGEGWWGGRGVRPLGRKPGKPLASWKNPTIWPASLMPKASVPPVAKGSSKVVKMPPLSRNPCVPLASLYSPTICSASLTPSDAVLSAEGWSMVLKAPKGLRKKP